MKIVLESIILFVKDISMLKAFYNQSFGFAVEEEIGTTWVELGSGQFKFALHQIPEEYIDKDDPVWNTENNVKMVYTIDDGLTEFREKLIGNNVEVGEIQSWEGYPFTLFDGKDPEGNVFQVKQIKIL
jgi:catechol-2,3-dioxygenase